ncbi:MAG TPA: hypothetical protein DCO89_00815 [Clostridiales bacterium]|nr:hypothetical protein [Clostridiales bacterium]
MVKLTSKQMKRFFNFRPLLLIFLTTIGAVYSVIKAFLGSFVPLAIFGVFVLFNLVVFTISLFKKDVLQGFFKVFGVKSAKICCAIVLISAVVFSAIASITFVVSKNMALPNENYNITASVKETLKEDDKTKLLLGNVKINGKDYNFNILATVQEGEYDAGDVLSFNSYLYQSKLVNNGRINTNILKTNVHYYCTINLDNLTRQSGKAGFVDALKNNTKSILFDNMTEENAGFAYAVLFGDKSLLTDTYTDIFRNGGLAHILAVSGMHIAFLVGAVLFVLRLCKVKNRAQFFVVFGVLLLYNVLCNFSPSVFRASVMSLCLMLGMILGERSDSISNISLAGIIVLAFQSLYLFDVGFLLSFGTVFGIFIFAKTFEKLFRKIKFQKFLASSVSVIVGATLGTLPWVCKYFKILAPISFVSNLFVVPLFSIMYVLLLFGVALNLIVSLPFLIVASQFFVNIVVQWSAVFSKFGVITTINFDTLSAIIYYVICLLASPYFMVKTKSKMLCALSALLMLTSCLANCNSAKIHNKNMLFANENTSKTLFFTTESGKTLLNNASNDKYFTYHVGNFLAGENVKQIDYFMVYNYVDDMQKNVSYIVNTYKVQNLYLFGEYTSGTLLGLINSIYSSSILNVVSNGSINLDDEIVIDCFNVGNTIKAVSLKIQDYKTLQILNSVTKNEILTESIFAQNFNIVYAKRYYSRYFAINTENFISSSATETADNLIALQPDESYCFEF